MKKISKNTIGRLGEEAVCQFLLEKGQIILQRNWRIGHLEVDIISLAQNGIHFVEVKTRIAPVMASPEENVRSQKQKKIAQAAARFLSQEGKKPYGEMEIHLDVAAVVLIGGNIQLKYFEDAYFPMYF